VDFAREGRITLPWWYLAEGHLDHGYARTTYGVQGATLERALYFASDSSSFEEGYVALTRGRGGARIHLVDGTLAVDEASGHRGHDPGTTGLDTVAAAMQRRRSPELAHETDGGIGGVGTFEGWNLRKLADEARRLDAMLDGIPADPAAAIDAASRRREGLQARRRACEQWPAGRRGVLRRPGPAVRQQREQAGELAAIDAELTDVDTRLTELTGRRALRKSHLVEHAATLQGRGLLRRAQRSRELEVRTAAIAHPDPALVAMLGPAPSDQIGRQAWRDAAEAVALHLDLWGYRQPSVADRDHAVAVLGAMPTEAAAQSSYEQAADAIAHAGAQTAEHQVCPEPILC